jgi:hypothetical protein
MRAGSGDASHPPQGAAFTIKSDMKSPLFKTDEYARGLREVKVHATGLRNPPALVHPSITP